MLKQPIKLSETQQINRLKSERRRRHHGDVNNVFPLTIISNLKNHMLLSNVIKLDGHGVLVLVQ